MFSADELPPGVLTESPSMVLVVNSSCVKYWVSMKVTLRLYITLPVSEWHIWYALLLVLYPQSLPGLVLEFRRLRFDMYAMPGPDRAEVVQLGVHAEQYCRGLRVEGGGRHEVGRVRCCEEHFTPEISWGVPHLSVDSVRCW